MSEDIRSILERLSTIEGKLVPVYARKAPTQQQTAAHQLPALLRAKKISVLGSPSDPEHPFKGFAVGANEATEPRNALEEAMQEVEEDMLSKVKRDLAQYLDKLEKKVRIDQELKDKAIDAVQKGRAEEDIDESDYELTDPETVHGIQDKLDTELANPQSPIANMESAPAKVYALEDGSEIQCWGNPRDGFELRRGIRTMPGKFNKLDHADMAVKLWQSRYRKQLDNADYLEEK